MSDQGEAGIADKVNIAENLDVADEKVHKSIDTIENSKYAKYIPMEFQSISIKDIIKYMFLISAANTVAFYLITFSGSKANFSGKIANFCNFFWIYTYFIVTAATLVCFMGHLNILYLYCLLGYAFKDGILSLAVIFSLGKNGLDLKPIILGIIFSLYQTALDLFMFYYIAVYFKRVESEDYDEEGAPIKVVKEGKEPKEVKEEKV